MLRTISGDNDRYHRHLLVAVSEDVYFPGDGAKRDNDGDLWLLGRVDDVMQISATASPRRRSSPALVAHPSVAEAAVVGATDPTTARPSWRS